MTRRLLLVVGSTLVLTVLQASLGFLAPVVGEPGPAGLWLLLASNALTAAPLIELGRRMSGGVGRRALLLWVVWGGIQVNSLIEVVLFDVGIPRAHMPWLVVYLLAVSGTFSAFLGWAVGAKEPTPSVRAVELRVTPSMLSISPPLYVVLYFSAGMLVWPYVEQFYLARPMPAFGAVLALQVVRGLAFGAIVLLLARTLRATRGELVALAGLTLSVIGGVAPLLAPNPYLPDYVRLAHLPEVGLSNLAFGAIVAWALTARPRVARAAATVSRS
jgi:hypothetical protein